MTVNKTLLVKLYEIKGLTFSLGRYLPQNETTLVHLTQSCTYLPTYIQRPVNYLPKYLPYVPTVVCR